MILLPLATLQLWITPVWLVAVGATVGSILLLLLWGIVFLCNRRVGTRLYEQVTEGILLQVGYLLIALAAIAVLAAPTMPVASTWDAITRLGTVNTATATMTVPANTEDEKVAIAFRADELTSYSVTSDRDVRISVQPDVNLDRPNLMIDGGPEPYLWTPDSKFVRAFQGEISALFVSNFSDAPAKVTLKFVSDVAMPEVHHLPIIAASVVGFYVLYLLVQNLLPGVGNIAVATGKEAISQPLYLLLLAIGFFAMVAFIYIPYNTFGEDVKMLKDSGLTTIMVLGIIFALWTSSTSIADEIDGKTALTLLSKPISRRQFIIGKFFGIVWPLALMFIVLGAVLLIVVSYKCVYDARETSNPTPDWQYCYSTMISTVPGLVLNFLEAVVLTAISVAISTRLSMLPNLIICGSIYVIGNLVPQIVNAADAEDLAFVQFTGNFIAVLLPMLHVFNIGPAIAGGKEVPYEYLGFALLYAVIYSTAAMLLALFLFEDRDLA